MHGSDASAPQGYEVYTPRVLAIYDWWVLGISNRLFWQCPSRRLLAWYREHLAPRHAEIGVGTGYFLDRSSPGFALQRLALLDANRACLATAGQRLARYRPTQHVANVLQPLPLDERFASVGLNYVLHCLPGPMSAKAAAIAHAAALLTPDGVLFGATILGRGLRQNAFARRLAAAYNRKGIFGNAADDLPALEQALRESFREVRLETTGCVALFAARQRHAAD